MPFRWPLGSRPTGLSGRNSHPRGVVAGDSFQPRGKASQKTKAPEMPFRTPAKPGNKIRHNPPDGPFGFLPLEVGSRRAADPSNELTDLVYSLPAPSVKTEGCGSTIEAPGFARRFDECPHTSFYFKTPRRILYSIPCDQFSYLTENKGKKALDAFSPLRRKYLSPRFHGLPWALGSCLSTLHWLLSSPAPVVPCSPSVPLRR